MEYTILQLATLAGISTRTLRYYDQIGLLTPVRSPGSGYRIYREEEVDALQQILFYKELDMDLASIGRILKDPGFDRRKALSRHLAQLEEKETNIRLLIETVKKTIQKEEGKIQMTDQEKFAGFKETLLTDNEAKYGAEIRDSYGEGTLQKSNEKFRNLTKEAYDDMQALAASINQKLEDAVTAGADPAGGAGKEIADLHRKWLGYTWSAYSPQAHRGLAEMYVTDERFTGYYDKNVKGCASFLRKCIQQHVS